jgi:hypothetical protein
MKFILSTSLLLFFWGGTVSSARAQLTGNDRTLGAELVKLLQQYNRPSRPPEKRLGDFFVQRNMVTPELASALKRPNTFDADPFTCAQDVVPGFLVGRTRIRGTVARVEVGIRQYDPKDPPVTVIYVLVKSADGWRIDDVDYSQARIDGQRVGWTTLRKELD